MPAPRVPMPMNPPVVIGISGGSGSGKTTVLNHILEEFGSDPIAILDHDAYYHDLSHLSREKRAQFNFDHPDALETSLMREHLDRLIEGEAIEKPVYDFTTHTRREETETVEPRPVIIIEGILVLAESALEERMDIKIYVDAADDIRLMRRIRRDMQERDRSIEGILRQYERTVRPMHLEFVEPSKREADIIIPRGGHNEVAIQMVMSRIQELLRLVEQGTLQA
ncbi:uridine kinase [Salinibacter ruber]|uniref:uridine kinase n=1 Tax=Salinibacter ruber TaxID=146919 RepID=UPI002168CDEA|nr:uridine kinase [Salinibacter ruber]MCS4039613.1 uridine kinase [Salinibacter ruber]